MIYPPKGSRIRLRAHVRPHALRELVAVPEFLDRYAYALRIKRRVNFVYDPSLTTSAGMTLEVGDFIEWKVMGAMTTIRTAEYEFALLHELCHIKLAEAVDALNGAFEPASWLDAHEAPVLLHPIYTYVLDAVADEYLLANFPNYYDVFKEEVGLMLNSAREEAVAPITGEDRLYAGAACGFAVRFGVCDWRDVEDIISTYDNEDIVRAFTNLPKNSWTYGAPVVEEAVNSILAALKIRARIRGVPSTLLARYDSLPLTVWRVER